LVSTGDLTSSLIPSRDPKIVGSPLPTVQKKAGKPVKPTGSLGLTKFRHGLGVGTGPVRVPGRTGSHRFCEPWSLRPNRTGSHRFCEPWSLAAGDEILTYSPVVRPVWFLSSASSPLLQPTHGAVPPLGCKRCRRLYDPPPTSSHLSSRWRIMCSSSLWTFYL
jgi:hypothetical protein